MAIRDSFPVVIVDGDQLDDGYFNGLANETINLSLKNACRQVLDRASVFSSDGSDVFAEGFVDSNGQNNSVNTGSTTATFDTNKYKPDATSKIVQMQLPSGSFSPTTSKASLGTVIDDWEEGAAIDFKLQNNIGTAFVVIEANSLKPEAFNINNCYISKISSGKWVVYSTSSSAEVARAEIYQTLFYGSDGSDGADAAILTASGVTAMKTSITRDVGKQAHLAVLTSSAVNNPGAALTWAYTGTFANTTTNSDCSTWSYITASGFNPGSFHRWEVPSATTLNTVAQNGTSAEMGTDLSADELNNPATCQIEVGSTSTDYNGTVEVSALVLCVGDVTWAVSSTGTWTVNPATSNVDYLTDNSIPVFTATTETLSSSDSGWLSGQPTSVQSYTALTLEPDTFIVRLTPNNTSAYPSVKAVAVKAWD